jgi:hypothetical protein
MKRKITLTFEIPNFSFWKKMKISGSKEEKEIYPKLERNIWRKIIPLAVIIVLSFLLGQKYDFTPLGFVIFAYFLATVYFSFNSRLSAFLALAFLITCPIALIMKNEEIANQAAVYAYYFLVICLTQEIAAMARGKISRNYFRKD